MIPGEFEYCRADSPQEAVRLLTDNDNAKLLAGGHSLLPMMKLRLAAPALVVDIRGIEELRFVRREGDGLTVGALATHRDLAESADVRETSACLAEAAATISDLQVRDCGTIGGSLAHADPAGDFGAAVLALGARINVLGAYGARQLAADELFSGSLTTSLEANEIITSIDVPAAPCTVSAYEKVPQPASGFAIAGVAACLELDASRRCTEARVAANGVSDRPVRLPEVEAALTGGALCTGDIRAAARQADEGLDFVRDDLFAREDYRRHLLRVLVGRAVARAAA